MRKLIALILGFSCCAAMASAAPRQSGTPLDSTPFRSDRADFSVSLVGSQSQLFVRTAPASREAKEARETAEVEAIAYRISYAGVLLLTADRLFRSFDSVLESMQMNAGDGTNFRFVMEPQSQGFEIGLRLTRPIGF
jgi:hypothetical protein